MRVEMGLTYEQIAEAMDKLPRTMARMICARAIARLAERMEEPRERRTV